DADKEGFLRSERALIQTIGRAARHINGKAILYADRITNSMQKAIDETDRRREKQVAFNLEHNITPTGARRSITDKIDTGDDHDANDNQMIPIKSNLPDVDISILRSPDLLAKEINRLEKLMKQMSRDLKFEDAAKTRDKVLELKAHLL
ncbi:UvrB/UvrC motif-containing protein, partial [Psychrobacter sp. 16-Bac2893]